MPQLPPLDTTEQDTRPRFDEGGLNGDILLPREACEDVLKTGAIYRLPGPVVESGRVSGRKYHRREYGLVGLIILEVKSHVCESSGRK